MAAISSYTTESISTLLSFGNNSSSSGIFGTQSLYGTFSSIDISTLTSIRNGSYGKALRTYYTNTEGTSTTSSDSKISSLYKDTDSTDTASQKLNAASVKNTASDVVDSASTLKKTSLWEKKSVTDEQGNTTQEYDKDAIYKAVSQFVSDYNALIDSTADSDDNSVLRTASTMVNYTNANKELLNDLGITIKSDNKLSIDEKAFKESSMTMAKSAFAGSGSYGQTISKNASSIYSAAVSQLAKLDSATTYSSAGQYSYMTSATFNQYL